MPPIAIRFAVREGAPTIHRLIIELPRLARLAVERGRGRFEWNVLDWNAPAIGFYESLGATPQSEWVGYRLEGEALARLARSPDGA